MYSHRTRDIDILFVGTMTQRRYDILKEIQANNITLGSLLSVTQTQLVSINAIKEALAPTTPKEIVEQKSAPSAEVAAPVEGKTLGDAASEALSMIPGGSGKGTPGKKGIGGKILSGIGKAARFLGPAAAVAGAGAGTAHDTFSSRGPTRRISPSVTGTLAAILTPFT